MKTRRFWGAPYAIVSHVVWVLFLVPVFGQSGFTAEGTDTSAAFSIESGSGAHAENTSGRPEGQKTGPTGNKNSSNASTPGGACATATQSPSNTLTFGERFRIYRHSLVDFESLVGPVFGAGVSQGDDAPPEWRQGAEGYGRRLASGMARNLTAGTISFGFAAADGEDPRYTPCAGRGILPRAGHAILWTFVARTHGARIPAFSRIAGFYGAGFMADAWYPKPEANTAHALERGSTALASSVGFHVFREFWPDIRKALHLR